MIQFDQFFDPKSVCFEFSTMTKQFDKFFDQKVFVLILVKWFWNILKSSLREGFFWNLFALFHEFFTLSFESTYHYSGAYKVRCFILTQRRCRKSHRNISINSPQPHQIKGNAWYSRLDSLVSHRWILDTFFFWKISYYAIF